MASKRSEINSINPFDSRPVEKHVNVQKAKGLTVRDAGKVDNQSSKEVDENNYSKPKNKPKTTVSRPPLIVIPGPRKPSFTVYCEEEDEFAQDGYDSKIHQEIVDKSDSESVATDFSAWHKGSNENSRTSENDFAEATPSKVLTPDVVLETEKSKRRDRKADEDDDDLFLSVIDDDSSLFHTAQQIPEKLQLRPEERISCHPDYEEDIYLYMRNREDCLRPNPRYLRKQTDISYEMRYILIDWLADVTMEYDLSLECLHLAVSIVDRTLSVLYCPRLKLQLVGATAIMIATKFEEIFPPELKEFVYITDETYSAAQILRMERVLLSTLRFDVSAPTSNWFGSRVARKAQCDKQRIFIMSYLLELALLDYRYLRYRSSVLACAALCLANVMAGAAPWPTALELDTGVTLEQMTEPMHKLLVSFNEASRAEHKAIYEKYAGPKYNSVACLPPPCSLPTE